MNPIVTPVAFKSANIAPYDLHEPVDSSYSKNTYINILFLLTLVCLKLNYIGKDLLNIHVFFGFSSNKYSVEFFLKRCWSFTVVVCKIIVGTCVC